MKLTSLLVLTAVMHVSAASIGQNVTINGKDLSLEEVMHRIQDQTGYEFFFKSRWLESARPVTLQLMGVPLEKALQASFANQPLTYKIYDKTIILEPQKKVVIAGAVSAPPPPVLEGTITDEAGHPLQFVSVELKELKKGLQTDASGLFSFKDVPAGTYTLVVSSVGYQTHEMRITVTGGTTRVPAIHLKVAANNLNEMVVTALGIQRQSKSLSYSTQKVTAEQINTVRDASFTNTLTGKVAGLVVTPSGTGPGGSTRILLRGNRSITGSNNALIVVDGVAIDNSSLPGQPADDYGGQYGSDGAANINPDDIESVNVLKGPAGAALYGSRAANGVLIITTKKGRAGKMQVDANSGFTSEKPMLLPKLQNTYSQGGGGAFQATSNSSWGSTMSGQQVTDWTGKTVGLQAYPNNIKDFFHTGMNVNNSVAFSGGSDKLQSFMSYANEYAEGIIPSNTLRRHTMNLRLNADISPRLSAEAKVTYILQDIFNKPLVGGQGSVIANLYRIPRSVNLNDLKDYKTTSSTGIETQRYWTTGEAVDMNPYWTINNTHHDEDRSRIIGLASLKYKLTPWLNLQGRISSDSYNDFIKQSYANNTLYYAAVSGGYYSEESDYVAERNVDILLNGNNKIGSDWKVTYNVGASNLSRESRRRVNIANGLQLPNMFDLSFAKNLSATTGAIQRKLRSVYGTAQVGFRDYLFVDLTARNDWSSTLPEPYSYFYPSVGVTAVLSDMMKLPDWVSFAKVNASYAKVGNDADPYLLLQTYAFNAGNYGGYVGSSTTKVIGNLKPELTEAFEVGTEWRFFNNRLGAAVSLYRTNTRNQLLLVAAPPSSGYTYQYINAGNIRNQGVELMLTANPVKLHDFSWNTTVNFALNQNKIIELTPTVDRAYLGGSIVRTATPVAQVGGSYGDMYAYTWTRQSGQYVVDTSGKPVLNSALSKVGNFNPKFTIGFNNSFSYKNWNLGVLIDGKFGGVVTSGSDAISAYLGNAAYTTAYRDGGWVLNAIQSGGAKNTKAISAQTFWTTVAQGDYSTGEFFTYHATNVRVRELSLGYNFSNLPVTFIKGARLSLVARNLLFLYRGYSIMDIPGLGRRKMNFDPEVSLGSGNYQGIEYDNMPSTRSLGVNLKLSF